MANLRLEPPTVSVRPASKAAVREPARASEAARGSFGKALTVDRDARALPRMTGSPEKSGPVRDPARQDATGRTPRKADTAETAAAAPKVPAAKPSSAAKRPAAANASDTRDPSAPGASATEPSDDAPATATGEEGRETAAEEEARAVADPAQAAGSVTGPEVALPTMPPPIAERAPTLPQAPQGESVAGAAEAAVAGTAPAAARGTGRAAPGNAEAGETATGAESATAADPSGLGATFAALLDGSAVPATTAPAGAGLAVPAKTADAPGVAPTASQPASAPVPLGAVPMTIALRSLQDANRFDIRLDPVELGRIDVRLDIDKERGTVTADLVVDRPATLALLQRDAGTLQQALSQAGLDASGGISLSLRDGGESRSQGDAPGGSRSGPTHPRRQAEPTDITDPSPWRAVRLSGIDIRI